MANIITKNIPNALTCLNLVSGCIAVFMTFHLHEAFGALNGAEWAMIAIVAAAAFDFCDGMAARLLKASSNIGGDLDSLSDLVSFGVAPGMLMLNAMVDHGTVLIAAMSALVIPVCGAIRLAKFNNDSTQSVNFRGLPIPANALFWIGAYSWLDHSVHYPGWFPIALVMLLVGLWMTSDIKMFSLKFKSLDFAENFLRYMLVLGAVAFVLFYGLSGLMWAILLYFLLSYFGRNRF